MKILSAMAAVALAFSIASTATADDPAVSALREISGELLECSAWFNISAVCISGHPEASPALIEKLNQSSKKVGTTAMSIAISLGQSEKAIAAYIKLMHNKIRSSMDENCSNISVAILRYNEYCAGLLKDTNARMAELLSGQKCTGSYDCSR